jgi:chromosome segregation ATPase
MTLSGKDPTRISVHMLENLANGQPNVTTLTIQELADAFLAQRKQLLEIEAAVANEAETASEQIQSMDDALGLKTQALAQAQDALDKAANRIVELEDQVSVLNAQVEALTISKTSAEETLRQMLVVQAGQQR